MRFLGKQFSSTDADHGVYDKWQVAAFLEAAAIRVAAMESTDTPEEPLVSGAILTGWAEWADSTRFETSRRLWESYAADRADQGERHRPRTVTALALWRKPLAVRDHARSCWIWRSCLCWVGTAWPM